MEIQQGPREAQRLSKGWSRGGGGGAGPGCLWLPLLPPSLTLTTRLSEEGAPLTLSPRVRCAWRGERPCSLNPGLSRLLSEPRDTGSVTALHRCHFPAGVAQRDSGGDTRRGAVCLHPGFTDSGERSQ